MRKTVFACLIACFLVGIARGETVTLNSALDRLLNETTRGRIITGEREVAHSKYRAERIGYYIPEISFNTTLPSYQQSQDFGYRSGYTEPIFYKDKSIASSGNLQLKQKIITGGDLTLSATYNLSDQDNYPVTSFRQVAVEGEPDSTIIISELTTGIYRRRGGNFSIQFSQPIFRNSESRSSYLDARDNLNKADVQWRATAADLKKEGISAYFDLITADIDLQIANYQSQLADFNAKWDSVKYNDSVITEEAWIESKSARLEKRLAMFDAEATFQEKTNDYNHLMDYPSGAGIELQIPSVPEKPDEKERRFLLANVDKTAESELARLNMEMAERGLSRTRSSMGLNGTLNATYSSGRGEIKKSLPMEETTDRTDTKDWRVSFEITYPIWDGGASGANLHSQELAYESARLEYLAAERNAKNKMEILLKRIEINHAKLSLLEQELDLAEQKLQDAEERHEIGMISDGALLENRVFYFEARKNRLATLKNYYLDITELEKIELP
jgi:outer membrane protein TolC